jgi:hypothetical protein
MENFPEGRNLVMIKKNVPIVGPFAMVKVMLSCGGIVPLNLNKKLPLPPLGFSPRNDIVYEKFWSVGLDVFVVPAMRRAKGKTIERRMESH